LLLDWRVVAGLVLIGTIFGIVGIYCSGLFFRWSGRLFGGHAPAIGLRAALAWGQLPLLLSIAVCLVIFMGLEMSGSDTVQSDELTIMLALIVVAGQFWAIALTWLMLGRLQKFGFWRTAGSSILGWLLSIFFAGLLALLCRTFVFQSFNTPSGSMTPTLHVGDYFFVSKYAYGYTHYSLPYSPKLFSGRIFASEPQRGDVVVYRLPTDDRVDFVKRVVGLPGDRIQMIQGRLVINGDPVKRERIEDFGRGIKRWRETLPNGVTHETLDMLESGPLDNTAEFQVPAGHYFIMGDHRDNSSDSRLPAAVGSIPFENLIGRVAIIYFSAAPDSSGAARAFGLHRFGLVR
jgi:signal peptidase I